MSTVTSGIFLTSSVVVCLVYAPDQALAGKYRESSFATGCVWRANTCSGVIAVATLAREVRIMSRIIPSSHGVVICFREMPKSQTQHTSGVDSGSSTFVSGARRDFSVRQGKPGEERKVRRA